MTQASAVDLLDRQMSLKKVIHDQKRRPDFENADALDADYVRVPEFI